MSHPSGKKFIVYSGYEFDPQGNCKHHTARQVMIKFKIHPNDCFEADSLPPLFNIASLIQVSPSGYRLVP